MLAISIDQWDSPFSTRCVMLSSDQDSLRKFELQTATPAKWGVLGSTHAQCVCVVGTWSNLCMARMSQSHRVVQGFEQNSILNGQNKQGFQQTQKLNSTKTCNYVAAESVAMIYKALLCSVHVVMTLLTTLLCDVMTSRWRCTGDQWRFDTPRMRILVKREDKQVRNGRTEFTRTFSLLLSKMQGTRDCTDSHMCS